MKTGKRNPKKKPQETKQGGVKNPQGSPNLTKKGKYRNYTNVLSLAPSERKFYGAGIPGVDLKGLRGKLIVVEGADGSGRSTQIASW